MLAMPCHNFGMVSYTIVPRGRGYWIIANGNNGVRHPLERYDTEDKAVRRLRELQNVADAVDRKKIVPSPKERR
jgi:RNA-splicing ligase RtcB